MSAACFLNVHCKSPADTGCRPGDGRGVFQVAYRKYGTSFQLRRVDYVPRGRRLRVRMDEDMRILVLGADGYLGWPTALYLSDHGHEVAVLDNFARRGYDAEL